MSYLQETWHNLKTLTPFKTFIYNFLKNPKQALLNELSPSSWLNPDHKLHWSNLKPEMIGWGKHIIIGAVAYAVLHFFKLEWRVSLATIAVATFIVEVVQFFKTRALFINPINSVLDIAFYVLGGVLVMLLLK